MKARKPLEESSLACINCLQHGVDWQTLQKLIPKEKWQRCLKDVARQVNWDEEDFGITTLNVLSGEIILSEETMINRLQEALSHYDDTYTVIGYKRSGRRILDLLKWKNKIVLKGDSDFDNLPEKLIFVDDDVSSGRTIEYIQEKVGKKVETIILYDYNRTQQELRDFLKRDITLLFDTETFKDVRDSELMYLDYYEPFHLFKAKNFDLTDTRPKFQYEDWKNPETEIISIDLDGTLTHDLLANTREKHPLVKIVVNTGRDLEGAKYYFGSAGKTTKEDIEKVDYIIASNGATIYSVKEEQPIFEKSNKVKGLYQLLRKVGYNGGKIQHYGDNENDMCFVEAGFNVYAPANSWLSQQKGVKLL